MSNITKFDSKFKFGAMEPSKRSGAVKKENNTSVKTKDQYDQLQHELIQENPEQNIADIKDFVEKVWRELNSKDNPFKLDINIGDMKDDHLLEKQAKSSCSTMLNRTKQVSKLDVRPGPSSKTKSLKSLPRKSSLKRNKPPKKSNTKLHK